MNRKIIILQGLPGSGKSTWAKEFCLNNTDYVRVNRDDLRNMSGKYWVPKREDYITSVEKFCCISALSSGYNVVLDSTNFNSKILNWADKLCDELKVEKEIMFFDLPIEECIERDSKRENPVGASVIINMAKKYKLIDENYQ
jgi:predicted kinase